MSTAEEDGGLLLRGDRLMNSWFDRAKRVLTSVTRRSPGSPCQFCGKQISQEARFEQNTGSIGYLVTWLGDAGCHCDTCDLWFCGACSGNLGSDNIRDGQLCLDCPECRREAMQPILIVNPTWRN